MTDLHQQPRTPHEEPQHGSGTAPLWFGEVTQHPSSTAPDVGSTQELPAGPYPPAPAPVGTEPVQPGKTRRAVELTTVALLAALLASGGTYAATRMDSTDAQNPSIAQSSSTPGRGTGSASAPVVQADPQAPNWTATAAAVSPSVVAISVQTAAGEDQGSGVVLDTGGNILTNNHVVAGAQAVTVTLNDGRSFKGTIRGTDPSTDLAVVRLSDAPRGLSPISVGDSDALKVGDPVMAIGNPLGLAGTVTTGIVSALDRPVTTGSPSEQDPTNPFGQSQQTTKTVVTNAIQTSAAINPGNSGGALVNAAGQLVGINSAIASLSQGSGQAGSIGIGFAIPVREAKAIADQLISSGKAQHAYLGVGTQDGTASDGTAERAGAKITSVAAGTPAAAAGLKAGDVVIAVDGQMVDSADSLVANVRERTAGETVKITVIRGGKTLDVQTKLVTRPGTSQ